MRMFQRETLYELTNIARTSAHRFIIRARNLATEEHRIFIADCNEGSINKI